jgi:hypothetical protein
VRGGLSAMAFVGTMGFGAGANPPSARARTGMQPEASCIRKVRTVIGG